MSNWDAMSIQIVWFAADARHADAATIYNSILGVTPDSFQKNKTPTPAAPLLSSASGTLDNLAYELTVQVGRVDLHARPVTDVGVDEFETISEPEKVINDLASRAAKTGTGLRGVNRLALVTLLVSPAASHVEANQHSAALFGVELPRHDVSDLMFQINLRKPVDGVANLTMNRLLKFGVAAFQAVTVELGSQTVVPHSVQTFAASLTIDVNTVPRLNPLSEAEQATVWTTLAKEAIALRANGSLGGLW